MARCLQQSHKSGKITSSRTNKTPAAPDSCVLLVRTELHCCLVTLALGFPLAGMEQSRLTVGQDGRSGNWTVSKEQAQFGVLTTRLRFLGLPWFWSLKTSQRPLGCSQLFQPSEIQVGCTQRVQWAIVLCSSGVHLFVNSARPSLSVCVWLFTSSEPKPQAGPT